MKDTQATDFNNNHQSNI